MSHHRGNEEERHGIRIPGALLDEMKGHGDGEGEDNSRFDFGSASYSKKRKAPVSRKEKRKQQRITKKQKKSEPKPVNFEKAKQYVNGQKNKRQKPVPKEKIVSESASESDDEVYNDDFQGFDDDEAKDDYGFGDSDDYEDFDQNLVEEDLDDLDDSEAFDDEDDENQPQTAEDTMAALMALKARKAHKKESQPATAEETLALLKKKKEAKKASQPTADETMELLKAKKAKKLEPSADENMELLKAKKAAKEDKKKDEKKAKDEKKKAKEEKRAKDKKKKEKDSRVISYDERQRMRRDEDDIKYYAAKLGMRTTKLKDLGDDDGLFDGLDFLDNYGNSEEEYGSEGEFTETDASETDSEAEADEEEQGDDTQEGEDEEAVENPFSSDDEINSSDFDSDIDEADLEDSEEQGDILRPAPKENPYVAPVSATTKYVPPALRKRLESADSEQIAKIKRSIKGPLNRLSEANIMTIVNEINAVYMDNPRQLVTESLTSVVLESIVYQSVLLDTFVILHAALISAIYRLQGTEVGAYFIQTLVEKYEEYYKNKGGKEAGNLLSLLTACYSFQLISCRLLYNLINGLIEETSEINTELLLRIVKNAGQQLRTDDPNSLKDIIITLQKKVANKDVNARTRFLIETITNLKNNRSKINNEIVNNLITRMKKVLGGINNNKFHEPLQVSLDDIHKVETKGKWWLVGAAWKGNLANGSDNASSIELNDQVDKEQLNDILDNAEPNWMELARAQRMNTDIRRAIFISIMSSNDFIEAFTKLDKLRLKRSQEREIPKILLHCVSIEKVYNPYYGLLATKLSTSHSFRKTLQFSFWDFLKEVEGDEDESEDEADYFKNLSKDKLGEDEDFQLQRTVNLGKFFGVLIAEGALPLHSLKNINFLSLNSDTSLFLEVLLISFFDNIGKKSEVAAFGAGMAKKVKASDLKFQDTLLIDKLAKCQNQKPLLRGLQYFLQEKVRISDIITGKKQTRRVQWGVDSTCDIADVFLKSAQ